MWCSPRGLRLLLVGGLAVPSLICGQSATSDRGGVQIDDASHPNSITVLAGQFLYDLGGDGAYPYVSARVDHRLTHYFTAEGGLGFARINTNFVSLAPTVQSLNIRTPIVVADIALHAQLPMGRFAPYVGVSGGGYHRQASAVYGGSVNGFSRGLLGGLKLLLSPRVGLRGEFRWRSDDYHDFRANDFEQSLGLTFRL